MIKLLSLSISLLLLFSCSNEKSALSVIPTDVEGVAIINLKSVSLDLFDGRINEIEKLVSEIEFGRQNELKKFIKIIPSLPVNLFSQAAIFTYSKQEERILGITIPLMSEANSSIEQRKEYVLKKKEGLSYLNLDAGNSNNSIVLIQKDYLLFLISGLNYNELFTELKKLNKLKESEVLEIKDIKKSDINLFAQSNGISVDGTLDFESGNILIDLNTHFEGSNPLDTLFNNTIEYRYDTSSIAVVQSNINPQLLNKIPLLPKEIKDVIDSTNVFHGPISLTLKGVELRSRHFISYTEDEDFNLIEKTVIKIDTVNKVHGYIEGNTDHFNPFLDYFTSLNLLKKEKNDWYSSPVLLDDYHIFPKKNKVYFSSFEHDFTQYSHTTKGLAHVFVNIEKIHELENNDSFWEGYTIEIDPSEHFYVNDQLKSFDLLIPNKNKLKLKIKFKDQNTNSLIECIRILKQILDAKKEGIPL